MKSLLHIVKIGGDIVDNPQLLDQAMQSVSESSYSTIVVHGGGVLLNHLSEKLSLSVQMHNGRRITTPETMDLALMVYSGLINTKLVARLQALHCPAIGLTGADGGVLRAVKRPVGQIDYGLAGDLTDINTDFINILLDKGITPVFCAISCTDKGQLLNTNADTIASEIAAALSLQFEVHLSYFLDVPGVLYKSGDPASLITQLDSDLYNDLRKSEIINGGMLPKIDNGFRALQSGVLSVNICSVHDYGFNKGTVLTCQKV